MILDKLDKTLNLIKKLTFTFQILADFNPIQHACLYSLKTYRIFDVFMGYYEL